jgi:D-glycero-alpha-D-manno-heptose 1-phosphate guanylyltransferase
MSDLPPILILAGGVGSRLRKVVSDVPKPLAVVGGKPFLAWVLEYLKNQGLKRIVLSAGFKAACFDRFFRSAEPLALEIEMLIEHERLGTGGAIYYALEKSEILRSSPGFFCINGDSFTPWKPASLLKIPTEFNGSLLGLRVEDPSRYGTLNFDHQHRLIAFEEKTQIPVSHFINAGVYYFTKDLFHENRLEKCSVEYELFPRWLQQGKKFYVSESYHKFIDIGTPESYRVAQTFFGKS